MTNRFINIPANQLTGSVDDAMTPDERKYVIDMVDIAELCDVYEYFQSEYTVDLSAEIIRILGEYSGIINLSIAENQISFTHDDVYVTSRLTGGTYPNYRQIMPKDSKTEIIILKTDLQNILKSILVFSDKLNQIDLMVNPAEKLCTMTSHNNDTGEGIVTIEAALSGQPIETRMNHRYISEALQSITTDSVSFSFTEPNRAMVMKGVGDTSFTYLVMPMNR